MDKVRRASAANRLPGPIADSAPPDPVQIGGLTVELRGVRQHDRRIVWAAVEPSHS